MRAWRICRAKAGNTERSVTDMKKRFLVTVLMLAMMIMVGTVTVSAEVSETAYKYTIKVYAGKQGHFKAPSIGKVSNGGRTLTITAAQGDMVTIDQSTTGFKLDNGDYYMRGFRYTGHDNDEQMAVASFEVDQDVAYEAAYGLKGGMVKYTVHYLDENNNDLIKSEEFYGMVGDNPVVSFRYVEGYQPNAYNLTKKLTANEAENVFPFTYSKVSAAAADQGAAAAGGGAAAGGAAGPGAAGAANAPAAPQNLVNLDDNQAPLAGTSGGGTNGTSVLPDDGVPMAGVGRIAAIGGGIALLLAIAAIAFALAHRRRDEEDEDAEEVTAYRKPLKQE